MSDLHEISQRVGEHFRTQSRKVQNSSVFVKLGLVLGGATLAAVAHCIELSHEKPSIWTVCGLVGAALVFVGGAYMAMTEQDVGLAAN